MKPKINSTKSGTKTNNLDAKLPEGRNWKPPHAFHQTLYVHSSNTNIWHTLKAYTSLCLGFACTCKCAFGCTCACSLIKIGPRYVKSCLKVGNGG